MNGTITIPISRMRQKAAEVISDVTGKGISVVVVQRSEPKVVIADYDYFTALEETVIDLLDFKEAEKAKKEPRILLSDYAKNRWG